MGRTPWFAGHCRCRNSEGPHGGKEGTEGTWRTDRSSGSCATAASDSSGRTGASEDIFFHSSALQGGIFDQLNEGQNVEFDTEADPRDPKRSRAINVRIIG